MKPIDNDDDSSTPPPELELEQFREDWQRELKTQNELKEKRKESPTAEEQQDIAEKLFQKAVELERKGKVYDALPFYKKAVQILPEIEQIFYERQKLKASATGPNANEQAEEESLPTANEFENNEDLDLYEKFKSDLAQVGGRLLLSNSEDGVISTCCHISDLPTEILFYILRWVVSNQLDVVSLENCARVSKGMYLLERDEELWRSACIRVWGPSVGTPDQPGCSEEEICQTYNSWRDMFIERTRVLHNGCYISKTTYLRMGENSFQDQFYRPIQLVEYFRYIRFLPDGTVYMMTTADEPVVGVTKLRNVHNLRPDILKGHYYIKANIISCLLRKQQPQQRVALARQKRGSSYADENGSLQYHIEFKISSTQKRKFAQLTWLHYAITQVRNKVETSTVFDLVSSKYPPLWFSPVRSYHLVADAPLA